MVDYFNAKEILPPELILKVLEHIPEDSRGGASLYFREDYYEKRNAEIVRHFQMYQTDISFGSHLEIYEALSEQFGLSVRWICEIVGEARRESPRSAPGKRRFSGVRVGRTSRRMTVTTAR